MTSAKGPRGRGTGEGDAAAHESEEEKLRLFPQRLATIRTVAAARAMTPHVFTPEYVRRALEDDAARPEGVTSDELAMRHDVATEWVASPIAWQGFVQRRRVPVRVTNRFFRRWARRQQARELWPEYAHTLGLARRARDAVLHWLESPPFAPGAMNPLRPAPRGRCPHPAACKEALGIRPGGRPRPCLSCSWSALKHRTADLVEYRKEHLHSRFARLLVELAEQYEGERAYRLGGAFEVLGRSVRKSGRRWRSGRQRYDWLCVAREVQVHYGLGRAYDMELVDLTRGAIECYRLLAGEVDVWRDGEVMAFLRRHGLAPSGGRETDPPPG